MKILRRKKQERKQRGYLGGEKNLTGIPFWLVWTDLRQFAGRSGRVDRMIPHSWLENKQICPLQLAWKNLLFMITILRRWDVAYINEKQKFHNRTIDFLSLHKGEQIIDFSAEHKAGYNVELLLCDTPSKRY